MILIGRLYKVFRIHHRPEIIFVTPPLPHTHMSHAHTHNHTITHTHTHAHNVTYIHTTQILITETADYCDLVNSLNSI